VWLQGTTTNFFLITQLFTIMREKISVALVAASIVCLFAFFVVYFYALHMWQGCPMWTEYVGGGLCIGFVLFFALAVLIYPNKY
jgi:hypothetical protein